MANNLSHKIRTFPRYKTHVLYFFLSLTNGFRVGHFAHVMTNNFRMVTLIELVKLIETRNSIALVPACAESSFLLKEKLVGEHTLGMKMGSDCP